MGRVRVIREDFALRNTRGQRLECSLFVPARASKPLPCAVYLHGNASSRLEALVLVPQFLVAGIALCCFDFGGCGRSEGDYISLGFFEQDDVACCVDHLRGRQDISHIALWGRSMGAVTALLYCRRDPSISGVVLDSPFSDLTDLAKDVLREDPAGSALPDWLVSASLKLVDTMVRRKAGFSLTDIHPVETARNTFVPARFLSASGDRLVSPNQTETLFREYAGEKEIERFEGSHNSFRPQETTRRASQFLAE